MMIERDEDALIAQYLEPHPLRDGAAEVRVKGRAVPVWALIGDYRLTAGEDAVERIAIAYCITPEAMQAALAYYRRHKAAIDKRLADLASV